MFFNTKYNYFKSSNKNVNLHQKTLTRFAYIIESKEENEKTFCKTTNNGLKDFQSGYGPRTRGVVDSTKVKINDQVEVNRPAFYSENKREIIGHTSLFYELGRSG